MNDNELMQRNCSSTASLTYCVHDDVQAIAKEALHASKQSIVGELVRGEEGNTVAAFHGGRVDTRLLTAFKVLAASLPECQGDSAGLLAADRAAAQAIAERCWELLHQMPPSLKQDLNALAELESDPQSESRALLAMMQQRANKLEAAHTQAGGVVPCEVGAEESSGGVESVVSLGSIDQSADTSQMATHGIAIKFRAYKKLLLWDLMVDLGPPIGNRT